MIGDAYERRGHPEPITPLLLLRATGRDYRCLTCNRPAYFDTKRRSWTHYVRPWNGRRAA